MSLKTIIFFAILGIALGFTLPEEQVDNLPLPAESEWTDSEIVPIDDDVLLVRRARSPQRRLTGRFDHSGRAGGRATFDYTHPINKNWEAYAQGTRNFKYHDTSAHAGLRFKF